MTSSQVTWVYNDNGNLINITVVDDDTRKISWKLLRDITNYGVWKVFGQVELVGKKGFYLLMKISFVYRS